MDRALVAVNVLAKKRQRIAISRRVLAQGSRQASAMFYLVIFILFYALSSPDLDQKWRIGGPMLNT
jgi:hypothetical protein